MSEAATCKVEAAQNLVEDWQLAHEQLRRLARSRAGLDFEEGRWLVAAWRAGVHARLGFGSFSEYAGRLFSYGARQVQDKLRVAEALEGLPALTRALQSGEVSWSMLRELTRVATPETEADWLAAVEARTVREVERLVAGHHAGDRPSDTRDPLITRHVLRFEVSGEVLATFREAVSKLRRDAGEALDDDAALLLMARAVLGGPADEGRASYQVALTVCESCRRAVQRGDGEPVPVGPEVLETAACDAQYVGGLDERTNDDAGANVGAGANAKHDQARLHAHGRAHVGTAHASAHVGTEHASTRVGIEHASAQAGARSTRGVRTCRAHAKPRRAAQTIPPAVRRLVLRRDEGRCVVPGCRHATWVDVHHLERRVDGGRHDPSNLITLCGAHHRALHRGELSVEGTPRTALTFRHAEGTAYGAALSPATAEVGARAFRALRGLGFGEGEVRRALALAAHVGAVDCVEGLVRRCLQLLTERACEAERSS